MPDKPSPRSSQQFEELLTRYQHLLHRYQHGVVAHARGLRLSEWLLHNTPDGVAMIHQGRVASGNRRFHALCGLQPEWRCVSHPGLSEAGTLYQVLTRAAEWLLENGKTHEVFQVRATRGVTLLLEAAAQQMDDTPEGGRVALLVRDTTERGHWEQDRQESLRRDEFLALLAHELRNPLTSITGAAELLLQTTTEPRVRRAAEIIQRQAQHQSRMIEDLLDVARVREGKLRLEKTPVDLRRIVQDAVEATEEHRRGGATLKVTVPDQEIWVEGDATRLVQVVTNLLGNAAKFTPAGGRNWLHLEAGSGIVWVKVRDSGIGIHPDHLARVWDTFAQEERAEHACGGGLGLGLALVKSLVELHGGGVRALSEGEGRGAEFVMWLPRCAAAAHHPGTSPERSAAQQPRRVLIVDDNLDVRETLGELLTAFGHHAVLAANLAEAVALTLQSRPDAILCDLQLSAQDGYTVAATIRPLLPQAIFIAMSGYLSPEVLERTRAAGFHTCLAKPLDPAGLLQALNGE